MATKMGNAGHGREAYDPKTGKFISDGHANKYFSNPDESKKISEGVAPAKIARESAESMESPVGNLGKYAEPGRSEPGRGESSDDRSYVLDKEYGVEGGSVDTEQVLNVLEDIGIGTETGGKFIDWLGEKILNLKTDDDIIEAFEKWKSEK